jgi:hypothetical protein
VALTKRPDLIIGSAEKLITPRNVLDKETFLPFDDKERGC